MWPLILTVMGCNVMRLLGIACVLFAGLLTPAWAQPDFFDDMESGAGSWSQWPEAANALQWVVVEVDPPNNEHSRSGGIDPPFIGGCTDSEGAHALKQVVPSVSESYASYADFGATPGRVYAEVWVREEVNNDGTNPAQPVSSTLALVAGTPQGGTGWNYTDYIEIGVMPAGPTGSQGYSIRTKYNDDHALGYINAGVARQGTWLRLVIEADALSEGGQVRFYIQNVLVGTSYRTAGVDLQYLRVGSSAASHEDFWYEDAKVIDEFPPKPAYFFDDFEIGARSGRWQKWPEATETLQSACNHNHTRYGLKGAQVVEADPHSYASYADFGVTSGPVYAEVWVFDEFDDDGSVYARPVTIGLALVGASGSPADWTDYLQLGVVAYWHPGGLTQNYGYRTKHRDNSGGGFVVTEVPRKNGWTKLAIAAEALASGGRVRLYIDDQLVGTSYRKVGVDLQYVRLGVNNKSYDYIWYDDLIMNDQLPPDDYLKFDVDADGDVDQDDFAEFQECYTGPGSPYGSPSCRRMDANADGDVDDDDLAAFEACASGPDVPADPACDDAPPLP